jgi:hypothetical protein
MTLSQPVMGYDQDFNLWIEQTVLLLKAGRFDQLDIEHLVDELESMSRRDKREIISRLSAILLHLLKWHFQPDHRSASWRSSIFPASCPFSVEEVLNEEFWPEAD